MDIAGVDLTAYGLVNRVYTGHMAKPPKYTWKAPKEDKNGETTDGLYQSNIIIGIGLTPDDMLHSPHFSHGFKQANPDVAADLEPLFGSPLELDDLTEEETARLKDSFRNGEADRTMRLVPADEAVTRYAPIFVAATGDQSRVKDLSISHLLFVRDRNSGEEFTLDPEELWLTTILPDSRKSITNPVAIGVIVAKGCKWEEGRRGWPFAEYDIQFRRRPGKPSPLFDAIEDDEDDDKTGEEE